MPLIILDGDSEIEDAVLGNEQRSWLRRSFQRQSEGSVEATKRILAALLFAVALRVQDPQAEAGARNEMDALMTAFNSRDPQAWAATLNYQPRAV